MTKREICEQLARERRVETMIQNIVHRHLDDDLRDLAQIVYTIALTTDEGKIVELWERGEINYWLVKVIRTQYFFKRTEFDRCAHFWEKAEHIEEER